MDPREIAEMALEGLTPSEALKLFVEEDFMALAKAAELVALKASGDVVTFVNNIVINYGNVCVAKCPICAFYRPPKHPEAYTRSPEEVAKATAEAAAKLGVTELHINGGFDPELSVEYFEELFREVKRAAPGVAIKGPTMAEVDYYARLWRASRREVLERFKAAGLDAISGGGAELFAEDVRRVVSPHKLSGEEWLAVAELAHKLGIPSNATMLYGHVERPEHLIDHVFRVKELQERTGGVLSFIPVKFSPYNTELYTKGAVKAPAPAVYDVKVAAISRLVLLGRTKVAAYWVSTGKRIASLLLKAGANDLVGTMYNEAVLRSAGMPGATTVEELAEIAREAGRRPVLRDTLHRALKWL